MGKVCGIYQIKTPSGKKYIGKSVDINQRWQKHKYIAKTNSEDKSAIHLALQKYGVENCEFLVLEECEAHELGIKENIYINKENTLYPNGYNLVNTIDEYKKISDVTRKNLSDSHKGKKLSEDVKNTFIEAGKNWRKNNPDWIHPNKGIKLNESFETKIKKSIWQKGVPKSRESIEKMALSKKEMYWYTNPENTYSRQYKINNVPDGWTRGRLTKHTEQFKKKILCVETGEIFNSLKEAKSKYPKEVSSYILSSKYKETIKREHTFKFIGEENAK
jgi:group I intron endonuclease